jgi:dihydrofolate reductase
VDVGSLIVSATSSLDGYIADRDGRFDFAAPDLEVHRFVNDSLRDVGTYLLGRRLYEVMLFWETKDLEGEPDPMLDFAEIWRGADKIVFSRTLTSVTGSRTRLERSFDPEEIARLKASSERDLEVGGPGLAAHAFRAGLIDEVRMFLVPFVVGGGTRFFPDDVRIDLELVEERRFTNGTVYLRHRVVG